MTPQIRAARVTMVEADDLDARFPDHLAATLRRRGYDAHPFDPDTGVIGVQIRAVHVDGWRYPDGHWEFRDQPVHIVGDTDRDGERSWVWVDHHRELSVPSFGSPAAVAEWIISELPAPEHLTCRLERHPDSIDSDSAAIPTDWYQAWAQGGTR
jgi:hypothetical protein